MNDRDDDRGRHRVAAANGVRGSLIRALFTMASRAGRSAHASVASLYFSIAHRTPDRWHYESNAYEREKYEQTLALTQDRRYYRVLEIGCSEGVFTRQLAEQDPGREIVGVDISRAAIAQARHRCRDFPAVRFEHGDVFRRLPAGPFDLIFCAEILYYAGVRVGTLARLVAEVLAPGGRLVLVHPSPEAVKLHGPFAAQSGLTCVHQSIYPHSARPYVIEVFERRDRGVIGDG